MVIQFTVKPLNCHSLKSQRPAQLPDSPADTSKPHPHALLSALNVASAVVRPGVGYRAVR